MGPNWVLSAPDGPNVGPMNLAIREHIVHHCQSVRAIHLSWIPLTIVDALMLMLHHCAVNPLRPRRNRRHFADDIFKCILLNEYELIWIKISLKFIPKGPINNIPALVQIMAWRRPGNKPLSEPMMIISLTHICVTRPQ